jgi:hypothetical protein
VCFSVARHKKPRSSAFDRIVAIGSSDELGHFELVASEHKSAAYTAAFVRLALDAAFEPDFGARLDAFVSEFESISPPKQRKRKRAGSGDPPDSPDSQPDSQPDSPGSQTAGIELECTSECTSE